MEETADYFCRDLEVGLADMGDLQDRRSSWRKSCCDAGRIGFQIADFLIARSPLRDL